jgi:hypothetical protein
MTLRRVDLPAPFGPTTATRAPAEGRSSGHPAGVTTAAIGQAGGAVVLDSGRVGLDPAAKQGSPLAHVGSDLANRCAP